MRIQPRAGDILAEELACDRQQIIQQQQQQAPPPPPLLGLRGIVLVRNEMEV